MNMMGNISKKNTKDTQRSNESVKKKKRRARKRTHSPKRSTSHKSASLSVSDTGTGLIKTDKKERSVSQIPDTTQVAHSTWFGLGLGCSARCFMRDALHMHHKMF